MGERGEQTYRVEAEFTSNKQFNNIRSISQKLKLLGYNIIAENSFAVSFSTPHDGICIIRDKCDITKHVKAHTLNKHFLCIYSEGLSVKPEKIYVKGKKINVISNLSVSSFIYTKYYTSIQSETLNCDHEVIILELKSGRVIILNYLGKKLDITRLKEVYPFDTISIFKDHQMGLFTIYRSEGSIPLAPHAYLEMRMSNRIVPILSFDKDFKTIINYTSIDFPFKYNR